MNEEIESIASSAMHEATNFGDFVSIIQNDLTSAIVKTYKAPADLREAFDRFSAAINWDDNFIRCILGFHVLMFFLFLISRKNVDLQTCLFFSLCILVYFSETLNTYGRVYWEDFTDQNYFDTQGIFISIMYSAPLLIILMIQLVS